MFSMFARYKTYKYFTHIVVLAGVILLWLLLKLYAWINTQSTDNAYVEADISLVASEVGGVITKILVNDNQQVKAGEVIAEINDENYLANLKKANAQFEAGKQNIEIIEQKINLEKINLEKSKEALELAETNFKFASTDYHRSAELNKDKFVSQKVLDNAKNTLEQAKTNFIQAKLNVQLSENNLRLLQTQQAAELLNVEALEQAKILAKKSLNDTKIRAPIDGTIASSNIKIGNYVGVGMPLFYIVPSENLYVKANFKETQVKKLRPGMKAKIEFDAVPGAIIYGKIRNLSPATGSKFSLLPADNATGNFTKIVQRVPVLIDFYIPKDKKINIVPGMSTTISIRTDR